MPLFDVNSFVGKAGSVVSSAQKTLGTVASSVNTVKNAATNLASGIRDPASFIKGLLGGSLPPGAETFLSSGGASVETSPTTKDDWRVSLSLPYGSYYASSIFEPLRNSDYKMIFPYSPRISISHKANYNDLAPIHNNYPFLSYANSSVDSISIEAPFLVEDATEGAYWIAAVHYFRSVSKMYTGDSEFAGAPPPIVKLNGYGNHVFNSVPVVVESFSISLPDDVDYISAELAGQISRVPVKSTFSIECKPLYSREAVRNFSLSKFIQGDYITKGGGGFI
jgi:hypothetical protein